MQPISCKLPLNLETFFWGKTWKCFYESLLNDRLSVYTTSHYYHWFASVGALIYLTQTVLNTSSVLPNWCSTQIIMDCNNEVKTEAVITAFDPKLSLRTSLWCRPISSTSGWLNKLKYEFHPISYPWIKVKLI